MSSKTGSCPSIPLNNVLSLPSLPYPPRFLFSLKSSIWIETWPLQRPFLTCSSPKLPLPRMGAQGGVVRSVSLFSAAAFPAYWFSTLSIWGLCHSALSSLHWPLFSASLQSLKTASSSDSLILFYAIFPDCNTTTLHRNEVPASFTPLPSPDFCYPLAVFF